MWEIRLGWILVWEGFGLNIKWHFFDISVFNPNANRYKGKTIQQCYRTNEMEKKQKSNESILQAENGSFTPLVFSVNGGLENEANKCYSRIAKKLAEKRDKPYSVTTSWIRKKISFSMMKSIIICIRESHSIKHEWENHNFEELASYSKARYNITWLIKETLWTI